MCYIESLWNYIQFVWVNEQPEKIVLRAEFFKTIAESINVQADMLAYYNYTIDWNGNEWICLINLFFQVYLPNSNIKLKMPHTFIYEKIRNSYYDLILKYLSAYPNIFEMERGQKQLPAIGFIKKTKKPIVEFYERDYFNDTNMPNTTSKLKQEMLNKLKIEYIAVDYNRLNRTGERRFTDFFDSIFAPYLKTT